MYISVTDFLMLFWVVSKKASFVATFRAFSLHISTISLRPLNFERLSHLRLFLSNSGFFKNTFSPLGQKIFLQLGVVSIV